MKGDEKCSVALCCDAPSSSQALGTRAAVVGAPGSQGAPQPQLILWGLFLGATYRTFAAWHVAEAQFQPCLQFIVPLKSIKWSRDESWKVGFAVRKTYFQSVSRQAEYV